MEGRQTNKAQRQKQIRHTQTDKSYRRQTDRQTVHHYTKAYLKMESLGVHSNGEGRIIIIINAHHSSLEAYAAPPSTAHHLLFGLEK